jgi:hypothetical protein
MRVVVCVDVLGGAGSQVGEWGALPPLRECGV